MRKLIHKVNKRFPYNSQGNNATQTDPTTPTGLDSSAAFLADLGYITTTLTDMDILGRSETATAGEPSVGYQEDESTGTIGQDNNSPANVQHIKNSIMPNASHFTIHHGNFIAGDINIGSFQNEILQKLPYSSQAFFDTDMGARYARRFCSEGTRVQILADIEAWATSLNPFGASGYWISGMAGTGKSTIAMSVCQRLKDIGILAGSFFCTRQIPECGDYRLIIPTLSYQLAKLSRAFASALNDALSIDFDVAVKSPAEQLKQLLIEPWKKTLEGFQDIQWNPVFVLDALDECQDISILLKPLVHAIQSNQLQGLKFMFTSRPEQDINERMRSSVPSMPPISKMQEFILHQVEESFIKQDIKIYIEEELKNISPTDWDVECLTNLSGKLFIYAATVVKFVQSSNSHTRKMERLAKFLEQGGTPEDLKNLYASILESAILQQHAQDSEIEEDWKIIYTIISLRQPLSCRAIAELLNLNADIVLGLISKLQAVFYISEGSGAVFTFHVSFPEFIVQYTSSQGLTYNTIIYHGNLSKACFKKLEYLHFNMCDLPSSFVPDAEVNGFVERVAKRFDESLRYCCQFWSFHCTQSNLNGDIINELESFLREKGIYWIEAMSLQDHLQICGENMEILINKSMAVDRTFLITAMLRNLHDLLITFASGEAKGKTPHLYISILPFWENKWGFRPRILKGLVIQKKLLTLQSYAVTSIWAQSEVQSIAYSPDGSKIVSGARDGAVKIWDITTGAQIGNTLHGHRNWVTTVAFSPNGTRVVSGSRDRTVSIWDTATGIQLGHSLQGHRDWVISVVYSCDGTRILSGSTDGTVRIWDANTGVQLGNSVLGREHSLVASIAFSSDRTKVVSGSKHGAMTILNIITCTQDYLRGHKDWVTSVAFSPDGTKIVSGSQDKMVKLWDATTGVQLRNFLWQGHEDWITSVAFSPDGTRIASSSNDKTVKIWEIKLTGAMLNNTLQGHEDWITSLAFSPDGTKIVSGSNDKSVRMWDATRAWFQGASLPGHESSVTSVVFFPHGTNIVSGSQDGTVRTWDTTTDAQLSNFLPQNHGDVVCSVAISPMGTKIVSGTRNGTLRILDAITGTQLTHSIHGHAHRVTSLAFSPDGKIFISGAWEATVRMWDISTGAQVGNPLDSSELVYSVAFFPDGIRIMSGTTWGVGGVRLEVWNAISSTPIGPPVHYNVRDVTCVAYSPLGSGRFASGSSDSTVSIWGATKPGYNVLLGKLSGHRDRITSLAFSPDGRRIVSGSYDRTVRIWDYFTGVQLNCLQGHEDIVYSVAFSSDGSRVVSGSEDTTVRVWDVATADIPDEPKNLSYSTKSPSGITGLMASFPNESTDSVISQALGHPKSGSQNFVNATQLSDHDDWTLTPDGWIRFPNRPHPIVWIPPPYRLHLWTARTASIISRHGYTKLSFQNCVFGENWAKCIGGV
ncbi:hypothetical protein GYMLUDRAFT_609660 [Collybiopsis luxurians FD-317 M1]|uniref:Nephrocystin 3-like N-terminal domain-containing protein n=1 Tax=Collybiopsis luxurians FD-317 M1 TaxID=944289 RepID=A0A0D0CNV5_9AGAR|nr:hypothetical protein GYMLUDRAFT_609660 [Collybiopsis luxurians FD-317 M1]